MRIGTIVRLGAADPDVLRASFERLVGAGIYSCQLTAWRMEAITRENARMVRELAREYGVEISAFWCGWRGDKAWNFSRGPQTLGLVPKETRADRTEDQLNGLEFTSELGISDMATHVGFIPFNSESEEYIGLCDAVRKIATRGRELGIHYLFETGQETPITLLRVMQDTGCDNLGVNLDPANLLMYGMANPVDAARLFGSRIRGIHAKDGVYPSADDPMKLGRETPLGEGAVNYPRFISVLKEVGYDGALTIEREIKGDEQLRDILSAKSKLEALIR